MTSACKRPQPRGGGGLQLVLMRQPPRYLSKLGAGGGSAGGGGGIGSLAGGGGAARNPLLSHAYLMGVSGGHCPYTCPMWCSHLPPLPYHIPS